MQSLELLKQELITQKELLDSKGFPVNVKSVNPSPSEITEAIEKINIDFTNSDAEESDVAAGKTFYSKTTELRTGTLVLPSGEIDITENGKHDVRAYETANVNVQAKLISKKILENGIYLAEDDGADGYYEIEIRVGEEDNTIVIPIPSALADATTFYTMRVTDTKILIGGATNASNSGLWLYNLETETLSQLWNTGKTWGAFQQVTETKWLIGAVNASFTAGLLLYNSEDDSCVRIDYTGYHWTVFTQINETKWIIGGGSNTPGLLLYNSEDDSCKKIWTTKYYWNAVSVLNDSLALICSSSSDTSAGKGILLFNANDDSCSQIYTENASWSFVAQISNNKWWITATNNNAQGVLIFNSDDNSISLIHTVGFGWRTLQQVSATKWLVGNPSAYNSTTEGVLLYDSANDSCKYVWEAGQSTSNIYQVAPTKWIISGSSAAGAVLYNSETDASVLLSSTAFYLKHAMRITDTLTLFSSEHSSSTGLFLYNAADDSFTKLFSGGNYYNFAKQVSSTRWLIYNDGYVSSSIGIASFDTETLTGKRVYSSYSSWRVFKQISDTRWIVCTDLTHYGKYDPTSSNYLGRVGIYDVSTDTFKTAPQYSYGAFTVFTPDESVSENNYYISGVGNTRTKYTLYYNESTNTFSAVNYRMEV